MQARILIVDDDLAHRSMLKTLLKSWQYQTLEASDGAEAVKLVKTEGVDVVLSDVRMANVDGLTALASILEYNPALPVILMTAYSSVETAVNALRKGAFDYLIKPLDFTALKDTLKRAYAQSHSTLLPKELRKQVTQARESTPILARSRVMEELLATISQVAPTEATVLICGESGTGKELVVKALHAASARAKEPLIVLNCAALAENLLESELFGHEKGAFTGADKRREGRFVQADGGSLFLDEIGEMPLALQAKLLRVLQEGEVQRVGADQSLHVNVRVFAATNRNLEEEVAAGRFRQDLYFRLNVIRLDVPPLRERLEDIPLLAGHFLELYAERNKKKVQGFAPKVLDRLLRYNWPGNVRELENCVERAVILAKGERIEEADLPKHIGAKERSDTLNPSELAGLTLDAVERLAITKTLEATNANKSETARRLGITRSTLHSKLKKYALEE
ncbi:MAG: sigma-54-dependent Fis family transcriptional regulator [Desulfovibrionaceae bacterium]|nr:sigma-54-dependent Fis family transcriptional regulator [Desulfovibrionaceae bacterium]